jgi:hypothetical protein
MKFDFLEFSLTWGVGCVYYIWVMERLRWVIEALVFCNRRCVMVEEKIGFVGTEDSLFI